MNHQSIHLDDNYRIATDGTVEAFYATDTGYQPDYENPDFTEELEKCQAYAWHPTKYAIGAQAVLVLTTNVSARRAPTNPKEYSLCFDLDGVPGNMNPSIKRITGWRGTSNDRCVDACGIVTIKKISTLATGGVSVSFA